MRSGKGHRSITLVADGRHLLTDVVTSAGVLVGIALVAIFDWPVLDPLVALVVGINVLWTGYGLLRRSVSGILDAALPDEDQTALRGVLDRCRQRERASTSTRCGPARRAASASSTCTSWCPTSGP